MKKTYLMTITVILISSALFLGIFGWISESYTRTIDQKTLAEVLKSPSTLVVPAVSGTSMGLDAIHSLSNLNTPGKIITFGTSTSVAGLVDDRLDWPHLNASVGSMSIQSLFVMDSYLALRGMTIDPTDIVKLDLGPTMFTRKSLSQEVLVSSLQFAGQYRVDPDYSVHSTLIGPISSFYELNAKRIEKAAKVLMESIRNGSADALYETTAISFSQYHKLLDFSPNNTLLVKAFIDKYKDKQFVVDLMFMSPELADSQSGILFNAYVDQELIPYLVSQGIPYLDHRTLYLASDFSDSTHLNGPARLDYTQRMNTEIKGIFSDE